MKREDRGAQVVHLPGATCPIPVGRDTDISKMAETHLETIALDMYDGDDPDFEGKSRIEVAILSLAKDSAIDPIARKEFLDRTMGKPRQRIDNTNVNLTLSGFLSELDAQDDDIPRQEVVDVAPHDAPAPVDNGGNDEGFFK